MLGWLYFLLCSWGLLFLALSVLPYLVWHFWLSIFSTEQDLKVKYSAEWALVTGASSGIGKALAFKCASQGLNVVLAARPDDLLDHSFREIQSKFKDRTFRKLALDFSKPGYVQEVASATSDISVQVCFLNAGYVQTGFFHQTELEKHRANVECNVGHVVGLTYLFINRLLKSGKRGCFMFTSSAAAVMPGPFCSLYSSTKAFLSSFGSSVAAEVFSKGIDVTVFHPSPVASRFAASADHQIDMLDFFNKFALPPEHVADAMFKAIGRCVWRDFGAVALIFRMFGKLMDYNLLAWLTAATAHTMGDYKKHWKSD